MLKKKNKENRAACSLFYEQRTESAVSPVVGVMLMLVVTIIIAAVVSGFSSGLIENSGQKTPSLAMDVVIINSGSYMGTEFSATVTGVSEPISTSDLKLITSWTTTVKTNTYIEESGSAYNELSGKGCILDLPLGTVYHGGAECLPGTANSYTQKTAKSVAPYGFGPGVANTTNSDMIKGASYYSSGPIIPMTNWQYYAVTHFGNFSLEQGTVMMAEAGGHCIHYPVAGGSPESYTMGGYGTMTYMSVDGVYQYVPHTYHYKSDNSYGVYTGDETVPVDIIADGGQVDGMQAVLGCGWENLRAGDVVNVKVVYTPTGRTIFNQDVVVDSS